MNKYSDALERVYNGVDIVNPSHYNYGNFLEDIELLKELINNDSYLDNGPENIFGELGDQSKLEKELKERLLEEDEIHKAGMKEMAECIEHYQKALDKACELLEICEKDSCYYCPSSNGCIIKCQNTGRDDKARMCNKEDWKEWLLKDD